LWGVLPVSSRERFLQDATYAMPDCFSPRATWTEAAKRAGAVKNWHLGRLPRDDSNLDGTGHDGTLAVVE